MSATSACFLFSMKFLKENVSSDVLTYYCFKFMITFFFFFNLSFRFYVLVWLVMEMIFRLKK